MGNLTFIQIAAAVLLVLAATASEARSDSEARSESRSLFDVSAACKVAAHPLLCQSLTNAQSAKDLASLAIAAAVAKAKEALSETKKLIADSSTDEAMVECLDQCRQMFDSAIDSLNSAAKVLQGTETTGKNFMIELSASVTFVESCSDAFKEQPELKSPVEHIRQNLAKLVANSLQLGDQLKIGDPATN